MKALYIILFLSLSFSVAAQAPDKLPVTATDTSYAAMYAKLKELYIIKKESLSQTHWQKLRKDFIQKAGTSDLKQIADKPRLIKWLEANIDKTSFKSYQDAIAEWEAMMEASSAVVKEMRNFTSTSMKR